MKLKVFLGLLLVFLNFNTCFALSVNDKNLSFTTGYVYLLSFDEKILQYNVGDDKSVKLEILSNIFNDQHEILVKPIQKTNTNLTILTENTAYKFDLYINSSTATFSSIQVLPSQHIPLSAETKSVLDGFELDKPPISFDSQSKVLSFELDKPPRVN